MPMRVTPPDIEAIEEPIRAAHQRDLEHAGELVSRWDFSCSDLVGGQGLHPGLRGSPVLVLRHLLRV